jgi:hypothetical protein
MSLCCLYICHRHHHHHHVKLCTILKANVQLRSVITKAFTLYQKTSQKSDLKSYIQFYLEIMYGVGTSSYTVATRIITVTLSAVILLHVEELYENYFWKNSH